MIRTTDTGGVKIIYNGEVEDNKCLNLDCLNEKDYYPVFEKQSNSLKKMLIIIIIIEFNKAIKLVIKVMEFCN